MDRACLDDVWKNSAWPELKTQALRSCRGASGSAEIECSALGRLYVSRSLDCVAGAVGTDRSRESVRSTLLESPW